MGNRLWRQMPTAVRRLCGHCPIGPSGVAAQSFDRTSAAMPPPPGVSAVAPRVVVAGAGSALFKQPL